MKIKFFLKVLFTLLVWISSNAQENKRSDFLKDKLDEYFKIDRETISLQLNKDTFLKGEEIWYKGYVYNTRQSVPNVQTTNVNIYIYNDQGVITTKKLDLSVKGYFHGNIAVDSTFKSGIYYIRAHTKHMRNFKEDHSFVKKIKVIENSIISKPPTCNLVVMPEGGSLIENILGTVAYRLDCHDYNQSNKTLNGLIINDLGDTISSVISKHWGLGKFTLTPKKDRKYKVVLNLDDKNKIESDYFGSAGKGVMLNVNNYDSNYLKIYLITDLDSISKKSFNLVIHKDGMSLIREVNFPINRNSIEISIEKSRFFQGLSIISLVDLDNNLVGERMVFNDFGMRNHDINVSSISKLGDSLEIRFKTTFTNSDKASMSASILPSETKSYNEFDNNLINFLIRPYANIENTNPGYFLSKFDRKNKYYLDLFLITEGKSKFDWNNILTQTPMLKNEFENGVNFDIKINNNNIKKLILHNTKNFSRQLLEVDSNLISIDGFYPIKNESLKISCLDIRGKVMKPLITVDTKTKFFDLPLNLKTEKSVENTSKYTGLEKEEITNIDLKLFNDKNFEILEEVLIKGKADKKSRNGISIEEDIELASNFIQRKTVKITQAEVDLYSTVLDYIKSKGFWVGKTRDGRTFIRTNSQITITGLHNTLVYFDDVPIDISINNFLDNMSLRQVEKILADKSGLGYGSRGSAGIIKIYSRKTPLGDPRIKREELVKYVKFEPSFSVPKKFYRPEYYVANNNVFKNYGVIHWVPEVKIENQEIILKIKEPEIDNISFFFEGMLSNGQLISIKKDINLMEHQLN